MKGQSNKKICRWTLQKVFVASRLYMKKDDRTRNWTIIVYPESAPEDWKKKLDELHIKWVCSPLHDKDINADGELKKAHFHVGLYFEGKKSFEQIQEISNMCSGVKPERMANSRGFVRYLIHRDNPEKAQYEISEIECHGGFDVGDAFTSSGRDKRLVIREMLAYIKENKIDSFSDFVDICYSDEHFDEWSEIVTDQNTLIIERYIKSFSWKHTEVDENGNKFKVGEYLMRNVNNNG